MSVVQQYGRQTEESSSHSKDILFTYDPSGENVIPKDARLDIGTTVYVTVKAKEGGAYTGSVTGSYRIVRNDISKLSASIEPKVYTGEEIWLEKKDITWKRKGKPVSIPYENYEIIESTYKKNINKGKATVTVRGTGDDWGGYKKLTFKIRSRGVVWWIRDLF